ncbi:endonuclease NucS domain-containing protein [Vibrio sp. CyArs1]|uniref:endonuclease NucS domain-containing protein n=1 Tax=Vibrio sp. CyArs1 TaxID=2682577 RepID=UPI001F069A02|nr:endonuclease NucS domain-containing protein [Vibrio sp. CyArs1]
MKISEFEIREKVAANLHLLDRNLVLVKQEYPIILPDGRKGFVDILARDQFGCYTIIEIKKSNQTARSTVQQLYKYASFFKSKNRLEVSQIRLVVVSTVWDELNAPFSEFKEFSPYEVKGYMLEYGNSIKLEEVSPDFVCGNTKPLKSFYFFRFPTRIIRDENQEILISLLKKMPSMNTVVTSLDLVENDPSIAKLYDLVDNPYGISMVSFTGNSLQLEDEVMKVHLDENYNISDELESFMISWEDSNPESKYRTHLIKKLIETSNGINSFKAYAPHTLNNIMSICDVAGNAIKLGPMFEDDLFTQEEISNMSNGFSGLHPYIFKSSSTPDRPEHFNTFRKSLKEFLKYNLGWSDSIQSLLNDINQNDIVHITAYNPLNIFGLFNDVYVKNTYDRVPYIKIGVETTDGLDEYHGGIFWNGMLVIESPEPLIKIAYPSLDMFRVRSVNQYMNHYDEKLSHLLGLSYELIRSSDNFRYSYFNQSFEKNKLMSIIDYIDTNNILIDRVGELYEELSIGIGNSNGFVVVN